MSIYETTSGRAFANDPDFDGMTGRVTYQRTVTGMTLDGWKVRNTISYVDIGRAAHVDAVDPEAALVPERFPYATATATALADGKRKAAAERVITLRGQVEACLREHGPQSAYAIATKLEDGGKRRVLDCLRRFPDRFFFHGGQFQIWSLIGQEWTPPQVKKISNTMRAIRAALEEHGPQTVGDLAKRLGTYQSTVQKSMARHAEWFRVVEIRKGVGNAPNTRVWGLAA